MVRAGEDPRVAHVMAADLHASVATGVQEGVDLPSLIPRQDDGFFAHAGDEKIARARDLALVPQEQPGPREDVLELLLVDVRVHEDLTADLAVLEIDEVASRLRR